MADEDATPEAEVVVVAVGDEAVDDGPAVPKAAPPFTDSGASPEPPPPGLIDVGDGSSNTIVFEDPPPGPDAPPVAPKDDGAPIGDEEPPKDDEADEPPQPADGIDDPTPAPPVAGAAAETHGATDALALPADLFDASPAFATGADGGAATTVDAAPGDGYDVTATEAGGPPALEENEGPDADPAPLAAVEDAADSDDAEGENDPGFFEQVADTVGDMWDDVTDVVT